MLINAYFRKLPLLDPDSLLTESGEAILSETPEYILIDETVESPFIIANELDETITNELGELIEDDVT